MGRLVFDYEDADFLHVISGEMAVDTDGNPMIRMGDSLVLGMDTGDLHMISSCPDKNEP